MFQCQLCSRGFTGKAQLLSHFKNVHSGTINILRKQLKGELGAGRWVAENCYFCLLLVLKICFILDAATLSGILKAKQKLGVTFNSDKLGGIDFTKFPKLSMCSAGAGRCWLVQWPGLPPRHCTWSVLKFL